MLYDEKDEPAIKSWIVKHLESPSRSDSDVDADVLADYVLALLRHEGSSDEVRKLCEEELYDFLKDETVPFVREVFAALGHKPQAQATAPPPPAQNGSRKRAYHESSLPGDAEDGFPANLQNANGHAAKLARRGGTSAMPYSGPGDSEAMFSAEAAMQMQQHMARMFAPPPGLSAGGNARRSRRPCRHFEKKGFCSRPDCRFAHGPATPTGDAASVAYGGYGYGYGSLQMPPMPMLPSADDPEAAAAAGFPYNPMMLPFPPAAYFAPQAQQPPPPPPPPQRKGGRSRAAISAEGPVHDQTQTKIVVEGIPDAYLDEAAVRSFFEAFGTVVRVALQPARRLAVVEFDSWASANAAYQSPKAVFENRFVKVYWHKEAGDGAATAKGKAKAKAKSKAAGKAASAAASAGNEDTGNEGADEDDGDVDDAEDTPAFDMDAFLQKQQAAQALHEEKRRKWEEVERQRQALEARQRALLAKQQEERQRLMAKMASVAERVKKKQQQQQQGSDAGGDGTETPDGSASSRTGGGDKAAAAAAAAAAQTEMIRAQLAALEEEAKLLGLDPDAIVSGSGSGSGSSASQPPHSAPWAPPSRGRGGYYRGAGGRGGAARGGGRGGSLSSRYAAYSLDNRPRRVAVRGVDFAVPTQNEALRQYLLGVGEYEAIDTVAAAAEEGTAATATTTTTTVITFADRRTAEKFFYGLRRAAAPPASSLDGEESSQKTAAAAWKSIPGVDAPVTVDWVAGSGPAAASGSQSKNGGSSNGGVATANMPFVLDVDSEDDDHHHGRKDGAADGHEASSPAGSQQQQQQQQQAQNVDFDVADEDWDMQ